MRLKKNEIKGLASIVDQDHESPEACAEACLTWLAEKRRDDETWFGVAVLPIGRGGELVRKGVGPYPGKASCSRAAAKLAANLQGFPGSFFPVRVVNEADLP